MGIKLFAKSAAVLGLRGGGQIAGALLDEYLDIAMIRLYSDTDMLRLPVYISLVEDQKEYTIPDPDVDDLELDRHLVCLSRVSYGSPADPLDPQPAEITSRALLSRRTYGFNASSASSAVAWALELYSLPGDSVTKGLELVQAYTSKKDEYVPYQAQSDARSAVTAFLKHQLFSETGKPWTDPNMAMQELSKYLAHSGNLKIAAERDFTQRDLTAHSAVPFII